MDMRFNLDQMFKGESFVTQEKIEVQEEDEPVMAQECTKEENEITSGLEEKKVKSRPTRDVMLPIAYRTYSYALHCSNLEIAIKINKETLLSRSMSKLRNRAVYNMFSIDASY